MERLAPPLPKRGPGRPSTKRTAPPIPKLGVQAAPELAANQLELVHEDPGIFKLLFAYFRSLKTHDIHLRCSREGLTFFTRDNERTSRVMATIAGAQVNRYYCAEEFWLSFSRETWGTTMADVVDASFSKVTFLVPRAEPGRPIVIFHDHGVGKDCTYTLTTVPVARDVELCEMEATVTREPAELFPLEFTLSARQFKKTVGDMTKHGLASFDITLRRGEPLCFRSATATVEYCEAYAQPEKIRLRADADDFHASVTLAHVRPLAATMVNEDVRICVREAGDLLFRPAVEVKELSVATLTQP